MTSNKNQWLPLAFMSIGAAAFVSWTVFSHRQGDKTRSALRAEIRQQQLADSAYQHIVDNKVDALGLEISELANEPSRMASLLNAAVDYGNPKVIQLMLDRGWNPNGVSGTRSPFIATIRNDDVEIAEIFLSHKASPNVVSDHDRSPLIQAISHRNLRMAQLLVKHGASLDSEESPLPPPSTPGMPHFVAPAPKYGEHNEKERARQLADRVWNDKVLMRNYQFRTTPLILAVRYRYRDCIDWLITTGAKVNYKTQDGLTAVKEAMDTGQTELVVQLKRVVETNRPTSAVKAH